jgi:hypothetical protein
VRTVRRTAAVVVLVLAAACSAAPADDPLEPGASPAPEVTAPAAADPPPADGPPAQEEPDGLLAFTGRQLDGGTFDGAAVTGDVVVWFWAPW